MLLVYNWNIACCCVVGIYTFLIRYTWFKNVWNTSYNILFPKISLVGADRWTVRSFWGENLEYQEKNAPVRPHDHKPPHMPMPEIESMTHWPEAGTLTTEPVGRLGIYGKAFTFMRASLKEVNGERFCQTKCYKDLTNNTNIRTTRFNWPFLAAFIIRNNTTLQDIALEQLISYTVVQQPGFEHFNKLLH